jgi:heat shock protein HtpX
MNNIIKTVILFGCLALLLITIGRLVGGINGMWLMLGIPLIMNLGVYFYSDKIAIKSAGAKLLNSQKYPEVKEAVAELAKKAKIPMPRMFISPDIQPNAFATGRNPKNSAVVVTRGLIRILDKDELKGVLAHELSHVRNRDILIATVSSVVASIIVTVSSILRWGIIFGGSSDENRNPLGELVAIIFAPIAAMIIQLAISRSREFEADHVGAKLAGSGKGLASALEKIDQAGKQMPALETNPAFANLYISNPFGEVKVGEVKGFIAKLFSTHPPVTERVARLHEYENQLKI